MPVSVAVVVGAVAALTIVEGRRHHQEWSRLERLVEETGLATRQPEAVHDLLRDPDPVRGRLAVARLLVAEAADLGTLARLPLRQRALAAGMQVEQLQLAGEIAREVVGLRPAAWQAPMLIGASRYLEWSFRGDPRLVSQAQEWRAPLQLARAMAPGEYEPVHFLALAELEVWPWLDVDAQARARELLRAAFANQATFSAAASRWLRVAASHGEAFALVPDVPSAWRTVERVYASARDWAGVVEARKRHDAALGRWLDDTVVELESRLRGGDVDGGRAAVQAILSAAEPDSRWMGTVQRAFEVMPAGPVARSVRGRVADWLDWSIQRWLAGEEGLSQRVVRRLGSVLTDLPPELSALADLAGGRLAEAEVLERRRDAVGTSEWAVYTIAKARLLLERGDGASALEILSRTAPTWQRHPLYLEVLARAAGAAGDRGRASEAGRALAALRRASWPATSWRWDRAEAAMEVEIPATEGLVVAIDTAPAAGAVVELAVDGTGLLAAAVAAGDSLTVPVVLAAGRHVLLFETVSGGRVVPGAVHVVDPTAQAGVISSVYTLSSSNDDRRGGTAQEAEPQ